MTFAQSKQFVLKILRKTPFLRGFKAHELNMGYIYCPYIPLITTPLTTEQLAETRRQLAAEERRVADHLEASQNVNLTVQ